MVDLIMKKMEMNEQYHQSKEKMAWLAASLYLTFSLVSHKWLNNEEYYSIAEALPTIFVLSVVYLSALSFVTFQFRHRWISVYESYALLDMLRNVDSSTPVAAFPDLYRKTLEEQRAKRENRRRPFLLMLLTLVFPVAALIFLAYRVLGGRKDIVDSRYHIEIPTYALITCFLVAQISLVF